MSFSFFSFGLPFALLALFALATHIHQTAGSGALGLSQPSATGLSSFPRDLRGGRRLIGHGPRMFFSGGLGFQKEAKRHPFTRFEPETAQIRKSSSENRLRKLPTQDYIVLNPNTFGLLSQVTNLQRLSAPHNDRTANLQARLNPPCSAMKNNLIRKEKLIYHKAMQ